MNTTYDQFIDILSSGDEEAMIAFLETHMKELPEDLQEKITFALFEDAVVTQAEEDGLLVEAQKKGLDILKKLEQAKKTFEDDRAVQEIKEKLSQ